MKPTVEELIIKIKTGKKNLHKTSFHCFWLWFNGGGKWYQPCYSLMEAIPLFWNCSFKDFLYIEFSRVLLKDEHKILEFTGQNTQSVKNQRFTNLHQIND